MDNLSLTPGAGASACTDQIVADSSHAQVVKLAISAEGIRTLIPADATYGLDVDVTRVGGVVQVGDNSTTLSVDDGGGALGVDDNAGSLTVDAPVSTPVFVRLSDGAAPITALPVTDNSTTLSVDDGGGNLSIDDGGNVITVDGMVTANQGTPAAVANGWPVKVSDGTDTVGISTVAAVKAMKVDVVQSVAIGVGQQDKTGFTEGTTKLQVIGGVYNETLAGDPTEDQASIARITAKRAIHVNLRMNDGTELGTATDPVEVCLRNAAGTALGTAADPVEVCLRNAAGTELATAADPLEVTLRSAAAVELGTQTAPVLTAPAYGDQTRVSTFLALVASQTGVTIWDPAAGKKFVITDIFMKVITAGTCTLFDGTNTAATTILAGTWAVADQITQSFIRPWISAAADNILKYTSGTGFTADITLHGYEITP
ncbi:MAG: hypothetical protein V1790_17575 [Planctomycetota bacterium]